MPEKVLCTTCKTDVSVISNSVSFKCPGCMKETIVRCGICRKRAVKYQCSKCGFEGP